MVQDNGIFPKLFTVHESSEERCLRVYALVGKKLVQVNKVNNFFGGVKNEEFLYKYGRFWALDSNAELRIMDLEKNKLEEFESH